MTINAGVAILFSKSSEFVKGSVMPKRILEAQILCFR